MAKPVNNIVDKAELDALRRQRKELEFQIKQSRETIERSLELLRRLDEMLAKAGEQG
jgi:hypothetical protein